MAIRKLDPKATTKLVSLKDEAVDVENSDLKAYAETLDISAIKFKEGQKPTIFIAKNVPASVFAELNDRHYKVDDVTVEEKDLKTGKTKAPRIKLIDQTQMMLSYFTHGISGIEEDGKTQDMTDDLADTIPHDIKNEIGGYVFRRTNLGDKLKK